MIKEECGLFGIENHRDAARLAYFGLYAQQHRGQESAGIVSWDGTHMHERKAMGLVHDVFTERDLTQTLAGDTAIGHVRYSTAGSSSTRNAQPLMVHHVDQMIALAHNGNLVNAASLRRRMEADGAIFQSDSDSEIFLHLIVRNMRMMTVEDSIIAACKVVKGAYSLLILVDGVLMAIRDPHGIRPLSLGRYGASHVLASETCAFDLMEAEYVRTLEPGEFVIIENGTLRSRTLEQPAPPSQCIFELVYFARPDSSIFGENVYMCRKAMGRILAEEAPVDADFVMPFPDSGIYCAVGYAQASGLPYEHALIRNHYVGRTFIQPTQDMRDFSVRVKINPVREMIEGKRIVIVDDSIVRGTTMRTRVKKLRELGAKEVHCRVSCPPVVHPCFYGVDFADPKELLAANHSLSDIRAMLDLDSLHFLSPEGLLRAVKEPGAYCTACFDGTYCVPPEDYLNSKCCGTGEEK
ncbi:Amidophosphoribosyltransferase [uncultured delta proteobacterium]|uniref:Amidophosphoribosyltransferase n=1 Tax=uncultured delta proteobacterium TaxID=34034 RepID=A0A212KF04_9DELT|nr:Amidophosphoribosyltransferase [uncultured delta proteobacterium]